MNSLKLLVSYIYEWKINICIIIIRTEINVKEHIYNECGALVERVGESLCENPVMTFPINERIKTELFVDRPAVPHIGETHFRGKTNDVLIGGMDIHHAQKWYLYIKRCVNERSGVNLS